MAELDLKRNVYFTIENGDTEGSSISIHSGAELVRTHQFDGSIPFHIFKIIADGWHASDCEICFPSFWASKLFEVLGLSIEGFDHDPILVKTVLPEGIRINQALGMSVYEPNNTTLSIEDIYPDVRSH